MSGDFRELLAALRPSIPPALLDGDGWDRLLTRVGDLPGRAAANLVGLELRLGDPAPAADVFLATGRGAPLRDYYLRRGETAAPGSAAAALGRFLKRGDAAGWVAESNGCFDDVILEYDVAQVASGARPEPGLFLSPDYEGGLSRTPAELTGDLSGAVGWDSPAVAAAAARVFDALPPGARVVGMGAMPDRSPYAIKLSVQGLTVGDVADFLQRAGWHGPVGRALEIMRDFRAVAPNILTYLDVAEGGPLPRLGLALHPPENRQEADYWGAILEPLVRLGWCLPEKREGLLTFIGIKKVFHPQYSGTLYQGINHVKLVVEEDRTEAKAYAWFRLT